MTQTTDRSAYHRAWYQKNRDREREKRYQRARALLDNPETRVKLNADKSMKRWKNAAHEFAQECYRITKIYPEHHVKVEGEYVTYYLDIGNTGFSAWSNYQLFRQARKWLAEQ